MATVSVRPPRTGRGVELGLLLLALVLSLGAYAQVGLATTGAVPPGLAVHGGGLALLALVVHLLIRWRAPYADPVLLPIVVALNGIGLSMIYRIDQAAGEGGSSSADRQLLWTLVGVAAAVAVLWFVRDHRLLRRYTYTAMVAGLVLLLLPLVPGLGVNLNGARIWIHLGSMSFQPAELGKILLAVFFAGYLVTNRDNLALAGPRILGLHLPRLRDLGPILLAWGVSLAVLVLERDLGTSLLFFGLFVAMLYVATERLSWVLIGLLLFGGGAALAAQLFPHVGARVEVWLHALEPEVYSRSPGGSGQVVQGLFGLASGGLLGTGWGEGYPQLVPYANSDFIVASLGEELGLTGLLALLLLYLVLAERGLRAAIGVRDGFGKLLASGLAFVLAFQCFVVVGGVTRLIPLTGLTMPFLALGGSSLLSNWVIVALLLRISDAARRPAPPAALLQPEPGELAVVGGPNGAGRDRAAGDGLGDDRPTEVRAGAADGWDDVGRTRGDGGRTGRSDRDDGGHRGRPGSGGRSGGPGPGPGAAPGRDGGPEDGQPTEVVRL
ncbi:FtsW/RodA/SpoVE family cell cycle protein [Georgenia sp. TF02-10]|uniref:FtsW/RodA/SpoVE family cell cycle protein n=1 Tax=Georgenia sp. TF02-10 TaxID=2917725 RepID=UPI001FA704E9|nr:FtsW/RodA/SpoVE family cell cycle protein [Georgenia sp. TF02-10]UNX54995.1 FtsW/RodA/SpoVE family cell cycle protein [Georgenia sp. TF02-10]